MYRKDGSEITLYEVTKALRAFGKISRTEFLHADAQRAKGLPVTVRVTFEKGAKVTEMFEVRKPVLPRDSRASLRRC